MRKTKIHAPIVNLPIANTQAVQILQENRIRIGLIVNNHGTAEIYLYDSPQSVLAGRGFSIFPGFGLALMRSDTCPTSELYAGQAGAVITGANLQIMEITDERLGIPGIK